MSERRAMTSSGDEINRISIRLPDAQIEALDTLVRAGVYHSRSAAIRKALARKWEECRAWTDSADRFIVECVHRDPTAPRRTTREVYRRYLAWCRQADETPVSQYYLTDILKRADVDYDRSDIAHGGPGVYDALGLSEDVPEAGLE